VVGKSLCSLRDSLGEEKEVVDRRSKWDGQIPHGRRVWAVTEQGRQFVIRRAFADGRSVASKVGMVLLVISGQPGSGCRLQCGLGGAGGVRWSEVFLPASVHNVHRGMMPWHAWSGGGYLGPAWSRLYWRGCAVLVLDMELDATIAKPPPPAHTTYGYQPPSTPY
jgi:hypothetical protein